MASQGPKSATSSEATRLLVVAGRDSSGGAGVDADLEVERWGGAALKVVVTAETRQGASGLEELGARAPEAWVPEAEACLEEVVAAIKFGLLPGAEHILAAAELTSRAREGRPGLPVVVDPVLAPTHGGRFSDAAGVEALLEVLLPAGVVLTPNLDEAAELTGRSLGKLQAELGERIAAAQELLERGARGVVLKGGHAEGPLLDLVSRAGQEPRWLEFERAPGALRGTGCRHATALALGLGRGQTLTEAASAAGAWLGALIGAQDSP